MTDAGEEKRPVRAHVPARAAASQDGRSLALDARVRSAPPPWRERSPGFAGLVPPQALVLCACSEDPLASDAASRLRTALDAVTDWPLLGVVASRHGMLSLLNRRVADLCPEAVPAAVRSSWRGAAVTIARRSLLMQRQLLAYFERLAEAGVPALVVKGPALAEQLYGDSTLRNFCDLDVLVRPEDVETARRVALGSGYVERYPIDAISASRLQSGEQEMGFSHGRTGIALDLHWRLGPRITKDSLAADDLFARSGRVELLRREVPSPGPLDVVFLVAVHAATHAWPRFEDVAAMAAGLRRLSAAQAGELAALAAVHDCRRRLHIGVLLAAVLARVEPPAALARPAAADRLAKQLAAEAGARLLWSDGHKESRELQGAGAYAREVLWIARTLDDRPATARHLWKRLVTSGVPDWDGGGGSSLRGAARQMVTRQRRLWRL